MAQRLFPVLKAPDVAVPWPIVAPFDKQAQANHGGQTLAQLAARGGLDVYELLCVLAPCKWDSANGRMIRGMRIVDAYAVLLSIADTFYKGATMTNPGPVQVNGYFDILVHSRWFGRQMPQPPSGMMTITDIDRDSVGDMGGATVTLTGTAFTGASVVAVAGVSAAFTVVDDTTITFVVPRASTLVDPQPVGLPNFTTVDVVVSKPGTTDAVLPQALKYFSSRSRLGGITWGESDFEALTLTTTSEPFSTNAPTNTVVESFAPGFFHRSGKTKCVHQTATLGSTTIQIALRGTGGQFGGGHSLTQSDIGGTDGAGTTGRYKRWYFRIPQATKDAIDSAPGHDSQIKMALSRVSADNTINFVVVGTGWKFGTAVFEFVSLNDNLNFPFAKTLVITADAWHEVQIYEFFDGTHAWAMTWYDGKLQGTYDGSTNPHAMGGGIKSLERYEAFGLVYSEGANPYPIEAYVDDACVANGFIDPP